MENWIEGLAVLLVVIGFVRLCNFVRRNQSAEDDGHSWRIDVIEGRAA